MSSHSQVVRRLGAAAAIIVSIVACEPGADRTVITPPTTPTPLPPAAPTPSPPATPTPSPLPASTVTGRVFEYAATGDARPVPNLRLRVRTGFGAGGGGLPDVVTDTNGRYEIPGVTSTLLFISTAPGSDHRFLCDPFPLEVTLLWRPEYFGDLPVVRGDSWSADRLPPRFPGTGAYGTVSERVNGALRPLMGATVTLDGGISDPPATTSATGFYMICSILGTDVFRTVTARKDGYSTATREFFGGWEFRVDLELTRD